MVLQGDEEFFTEETVRKNEKGSVQTTTARMKNSRKKTISLN